MNTKGKGKTQKLKINNNFIIAVGVGLLLLIIIIFLFSKLGNSKKVSNKYIFDNNRLISIYKNGLYGFINKNGKEIVKPEYDYIMSDSGKYIVVEKDGVYYILDNNGNIKLESKTSISYNVDHDVYVADNKLYNSNLKILSPRKLNVVHSGYGYYRFISEDGETAGVMSSEGKVIYRQKIKKGDSFYIYIGDQSEDEEELYCVVSPDNKAYQIINCNTGKIVLDYTTDLISPAGNNLFYIGVVGKEEVKTIFVKNNKVALEVEKSTNVRYYLSGYIEYQEDDKVKYYNVKTKKTLDKTPNDLITNDTRTEWEKKSGYTKMSCSRQYGIVDNNNVVLPCEYDKISYLPTKLYEYLESIGKKYVLATKDKTTQLVNLSNKNVVKTFETESTINSNSNSPFIYYFEGDNKFVLFNLINNREETYEADSIDVYGNYFRLHKDKKIIYYNLNLEKIYEIDDEK